MLYDFEILMDKVLNKERERNTFDSISRVAENQNSNKKIEDTDVIGVLVLACNRLTVIRALNQILRYRQNPDKFPVVVSFDCGFDGENIKSALEEIYVPDDVKFIKHPNYETIKNKIESFVPLHMQAYYNLAGHYHWALNHVFRQLNFSTVIIIEDDLDISPDIFEYFRATYSLLKKDPSLWCVSAYNDNGRPSLINETAPELLYRSDFFPGLGWMLKKSLWDELESKWPEAYWDDWMREPEQRKNRACIRPEISRTKTFGRNGASGGQLFETYLKVIKLNKQYVRFTEMDLSYLIKDKYDSDFLKRVQSSTFLQSYMKLPASNTGASYVMSYVNESSFNQLAEHFGLMQDFKAGLPRGSYKGIVPFMHNGNRVYLVNPNIL